MLMQLNMCAKMSNLLLSLNQMCLFKEQMHQHSFSALAVLCPRPRWRSLRRSPRPPCQQGRGHPFPVPFLIAAFGVSISARLPCPSCQAPNTNSWLHLWLCLGKPALSHDVTGGGIVQLSSVTEFMFYVVL